MKVKKFSGQRLNRLARIPQDQTRFEGKSEDRVCDTPANLDDWACAVAEQEKGVLHKIRGVFCKVEVANATLMEFWIPNVDFCNL